jgi:hypothetical protein
MKAIISLSRTAVFIAAIAMVNFSFAQPGPGGPGGPGPGGPGGFGPGGPGPFPIVPIIPIPPGPPSRYHESDGSSLAVQVQRKLKKLGYYTGAVDGEVGRGTRAAIRAYQDENGLEVNGQIDRHLLRSLGLL